MKFDMHCHVIGDSCSDINQIHHDVYYNRGNNLLTASVHDTMKCDLVNAGIIPESDGSISASSYLDFIYKKFIGSTEINALVLLAFDAVYSPDDVHHPDRPPEKKHMLYLPGTEIVVSNQYISNQVKKMNQKLVSDGMARKKIFWGASINPNRDKSSLKTEIDFLTQLEDDDKPVLMKWVPSAQHIDITDESHNDFYAWLKNEKLPLLCHIGAEYCYTESWNAAYRSFDDYRNLRFPAKKGVNVIAPHCNAPVLLTDKNQMKPFVRFVKEINNESNGQIWIDNSSMTISQRVNYIKEVGHSYPHDIMLNGTDFPVPIAKSSHFIKLPDNEINKRQYQSGIYRRAIPVSLWEDLRNEKNPFDQDIKLKRYFGFKDSAMTNPAKILRLPPSSM